MRLFSTLFNIAKLPVAIAADVIMLIPDISASQEVGQYTKDQCAKIDAEIAKK